MRYSDYKKTLGEALKELRKNQGFKQREVAEMLGITDKAYSQYETGFAFPPMERLLVLCELYQTTPNDLLGFTKESPLQANILLAQACKINCEDKKDGFIQCSVDDHIEKMTAVISYDVFMRIVNRTKKDGNHLYIRNFTDDFMFYLERYCSKHKECVIEHESRIKPRKNHIDELMFRALDYASEGPGLDIEEEEDDI